MEEITQTQAPAAGPANRSNSGFSVLIGVGLVLFCLGALATLAEFANLLIPSLVLPAGVLVLTLLMPVGVALSLFGLWLANRGRKKLSRTIITNHTD